MEVREWCYGSDTKDIYCSSLGNKVMYTLFLLGNRSETYRSDDREDQSNVDRRETGYQDWLWLEMSQFRAQLEAS
jgi:hypothetical protein